jgi:hypothetical protein
MFHPSVFLTLLAAVKELVAPTTHRFSRKLLAYTTDTRHLSFFLHYPRQNYFLRHTLKKKIITEGDMSLFESITGIDEATQTQAFEKEKREIEIAIKIAAKRNNTRIVFIKISHWCERWLIDQGFKVTKEWSKKWSYTLERFEEVYSVTVYWPFNAVHYTLCSKCNISSYPENDPLPKDWKRCPSCDLMFCHECNKSNKCTHWTCKDNTELIWTP